MSEDRLELLKKKIKLPVTWGKFTEADRDWLIFEVEKLRLCDKSNISEQARLINERNTLRKALEYYADKDNWIFNDREPFGKWQGCRVYGPTTAQKALATAKEDGANDA